MQTVLVIDDCPEILEVIGGILEQHDIQAVCASDPRRAIRLMREIKFDLVLCDLCLKESFPSGGESSLVGLRTIKTILECNPTLPVIVMSGVVQRDRLQRLAILPIAGVLPKPFTAEDLMSKVRTL